MTMAPNESPEIKHPHGIDLTESQKRLLRLAYQEYNLVTVRKELTAGKSGARIYLVHYADRHLDIAKFDHPYALQPEYSAYPLVEKRISVQNRVQLRGPFLDDQGKQGLLIYNFLGRDSTAEDNSLLKYYEAHKGQKGGGTQTAAVLSNLFDAYGQPWWDENRTQLLVYNEEYDRLLPVHFEVEGIYGTGKNAQRLQAGQIDWQTVRDLAAGQIIQLQGFAVTDNREDILRLQAAPPPHELSAALRIKFTGADPEQYQPGAEFPPTYARITATRDQLLKAAADQALVHFSPDETTFTANGRCYPNPLPYVTPFLETKAEVKRSVIHGDLNLQNIMTHPTGFVWLIDFAHTRADGPTLIDLQRLEEHVIAEMVAPLIGDPHDLVQIFNALHSEPLLTHCPVRKLREPYKILCKIRQQAKRYLPKDNDWSSYYHGLFLVFMGALKYPARTAHHRTLILVGAATLHELMPLPLNTHYEPEREKRMRKWFMTIGATVLLVAGIGIGLVAQWEWMQANSGDILTKIWAGSTPTATPAPTPTPNATTTTQALQQLVQMVIAALPTPTLPPTATPQPTTIVAQAAVDEMTTLARVRKRNYLKCGIAGTIPGFSVATPTATDTYLAEADVDQGFYTQASGFDVDFCKGLAAAIFGSAKDHVAFLTLTTGTEDAEHERFLAVKEGIVDVAFRNTTWTRARELGVDFGQPIYLDGLKFMIDPTLLPEGKALTELTTTQQTLQFLRELFAKSEKVVGICVAVQTSTLQTLRQQFTDRLEQIIEQPDNEQVVLIYNARRDCKIMASDESQLLAYRHDYPPLEEHHIIPVEEVIAFEPLAPFVAQGDSEWLNVLNHTIWAIMYAEQLGITKEIASQIAGTQDTDEIDQKLIELVETRKNISLQQYKEFLGIENPEEPLQATFAIKRNFALRTIVQVGNYGEIYQKNLGKDFQRGVNCVWNPLQSVDAQSSCRLIIPPP